MMGEFQFGGKYLLGNDLEAVRGEFWFGANGYF
jgi:hypothetical protein